MSIRKGRIIIFITLMSLFIGICAVDTVAVNAKSPSDRQIVREYCHRHYKGYTIRYFTKWNDKVMSHRANRKIVYVESKFLEPYYSSNETNREAYFDIKN